MAATSVLRVIEDDRVVAYFSNPPSSRANGTEVMEASMAPAARTMPVQAEELPTTGQRTPSTDDGPALAVIDGGEVDTVVGPAPVALHHVVESRETLWSIADEVLGSALRWSELATLNYGVVQQDGRTLTTEHALRPGWVLRIPTGVTSPFAPQEKFGVGPTVMADGLGSVGLGRRMSVATIPSSSLGPLVNGTPLPKRVPVTPLGGGVVGAGVVSILDRMRRAQQRHRKEGMFIVLPDPAGRTMEQRLRLGGGAVLIDEIGQVLRDLGSGEFGEPGWSVSGVRVRPESMEVVLDLNENAEFTPDGPCRHIVRVDRPVSVDTARLRSTGASGDPAPMLVTAGEGPDGVVMVNLEALGSLIVDGGAESCEGVLRALALELATSAWSEQFDLHLTGFGAELERFTRVTATDPGSLVDALWRVRAGRAAQLGATRFKSFAHARATDHSGRWDPMVVLCGPSVVHDQVAELMEIASDPLLGMALVALGRQAEATHSLKLSTHEASPSLDLLQAVVFPQRVAVEELAEVEALLEAATHRQSAFSSDEPYVTLPITLPVAPKPAASADGEPHRDPVTTETVDKGSRDPGQVPAAGVTRPATSRLTTGTIEVAVLGPVEVRGMVREFTRASARELVVYLAMHPNGVTNESWATALWPDRLMAPSSLHSTASVARRSLGQSDDGRDHLPRSHGRLALAKSVVTDWERFVAASDSEEVDDWSAGLALVRGRPFEGLKSSDWPILEGIGPAIESAVVDLARRLGEISLASGDPQTAEWAARRGLMVSPFDERLYRLLMRVADLDGNPAGVEAVMQELVTLVSEDVEPFDSVHPSTMELYRSLTRRRRPPGARRVPDASEPTW